MGLHHNTSAMAPSPNVHVKGALLHVHVKGVNVRSWLSCYCLGSLRDDSVGISLIPVLVWYLTAMTAFNY